MFKYSIVGYYEFLESYTVDSGCSVGFGGTNDSLALGPLGEVIPDPSGESVLLCQRQAIRSSILAWSELGLSRAQTQTSMRVQKP